MAAVAVNGIARTSSTTRDYLAISKTSRALTMHSTALAVHSTAFAVHSSALAACSSALAVHSSALAMDGTALAVHSTALAMDGTALAAHSTALAVHSTALAMDSLSMQRCVARPVRGAHNPAEVEVVIVRNFAPAFASFKLPRDRVEALARCVGEQVCFF